MFGEFERDLCYFDVKVTQVYKHNETRKSYCRLLMIVNQHGFCLLYRTCEYEHRNH